MLISEIFKSIDGEAKYSGQIATFIRTVGCPLRCRWCDSSFSWGGDPTDKEMSIKEIATECERLGSKHITFTGGEPLIQKDADELIETLVARGFEVSIETCGAIDFTERSWFKNNLPNVWICADYKCEGSGMMSKMLPVEKFAHLRYNDVLKFVVGSRKDLDIARSVIEHIRNANCRCYCYLSPVFGDIEPREIVEYMIAKNMQDKVAFQLQAHKIVWDMNARGV